MVSIDRPDLEVYSFSIKHVFRRYNRFHRERRNLFSRLEHERVSQGIIMKTALLFPPQWYPSQPYLALPTLKAHLESKGHEVDQFDFNIESYEIFLSQGYLDHCVETVQKRLSLPAFTTEEQEVKAVYQDILSDKAFLDSILNEVEDAKNVLRDEERFF